jgi:gamma-glutamylcyclotransferase (GGCT)/AIG2-like uncharacterized protein YtfP
MKEMLIRAAVYGPLITGQGNEQWGTKTRSRVPWSIRGVLYYTSWGFLAFVPDERGRYVAAELIVVTPETLDVLEGHPRLYGRETVAATLADGRVVQALVYVMRKLPEGARVVGSGDWATMQRTRYITLLNNLLMCEIL